MKILLVMPKYHDDPTEHYFMNFGLMSVSSYLKREGFDVHCVNLNHYGPNKLVETLESGNFDAVCTGGIHIHLHLIKKIVEDVKNYNPNIITIAGGSLVTSDPELMLGFLGADYLVLGEGEVSCAELLTALKQKINPKEVAGIAFNKGGSYFETSERANIEDLDSLPWPDFEGFEYAYYLDNYPFGTDYLAHKNAKDIRGGTVFGSRDCPAKCTFCFRTMGRDYRMHSVDYVMSMLRHLIEKYRINQVNISDEIFSLNRKRVYEFCEQIKAIGIPWTCQMRVNMADDELLRRMKDAGCGQISYGFESASMTVLRSMQKGILVEQIERAIELTAKHKMTLQGNFIFGDPSETQQTALETFEFNRRYKEKNLNLIMLEAYPGTPLYFDVLKKGIIKDKINFYETSRTDDRTSPINLTQMPPDQFRALALKITLENLKTYKYGKVTASRKMPGGKFELSAICPHCGDEELNHIIKSEKYEVASSLQASCLSSQMTCDSCYQRYRIYNYDYVNFDQPIKKFRKKLTRWIMHSIVFLITIEFEPEFHKNKIMHFFFFPVYYLVKTFNVISMTGGLARIYRKVRGIMENTRSGVEKALKQSPIQSKL